MNREIKFRAWDKKEKKMVLAVTLFLEENNYIEFYTGEYSTDMEIGERTYHRKALEESEYELMQFTGLKDKNGKEIYEGDIVKSHNGRIWEVKIGMYQYLDQYPCIGVYAEGENCQYPMGDGNWEIIGNIYENSELIK